MTNSEVDYLALNRASWDDRAPVHAKSNMYDIEGKIASPTRLSYVVDFDRALLPDLHGLKIVHLQCHIGTDTLSLARLGAASVTGLDFSRASLDVAEDFARKTHGTGGEKLTYVHSTMEDALTTLPNQSYDMVYTGIGALCWLPSIKQWAKTVSGLLRQGGRLFIREAHPMLWALNENVQDKLVVESPYFERNEAVIFEDGGTYTDIQPGMELKVSKTAEFFHGLGEIMTALFEEGMQITGFVEHQSLPWDALPGQMIKVDVDEYQIKDRPWRLPHSYTLQAIKL